MKVYSWPFFCMEATTGTQIWFVVLHAAASLATAPQYLQWVGHGSKHIWLVGQGHPSEKYEFVNWDDDSNPLYEWENAKFMATKPPTRYYATFLEGWTSTCQLSWRYGFEFSPASQGSVSAFGSSMEYRRNPGILAIWAETLKHRFYSKKIRKKMLDMNCGSTSQSCFQNHLGILISPMHLPEKDLPEPTIQSDDP